MRIRFRQDIFFCANSIETASNWFDEITAAISEAEMVWVFCSESMKHSTFCAYEIGVASALQKPIVPILLDHSVPPTYLQHLHADSVPRTQQRMPWLSPRETLQHLCLRKLQELR